MDQVIQTDTPQRLSEFLLDESAGSTTSATAPNLAALQLPGRCWRRAEYRLPLRYGARAQVHNRRAGRGCP